MVFGQTLKSRCLINNLEDVSLLNDYMIADKIPQLSNLAEVGRKCRRLYIGYSASSHAYPGDEFDFLWLYAWFWVLERT
jgi:hypothetical protein